MAEHFLRFNRQRRMEEIDDIYMKYGWDEEACQEVLREYHRENTYGTLFIVHDKLSYFKDETFMTTKEFYYKYNHAQKEELNKVIVFEDEKQNKKELTLEKIKEELTAIQEIIKPQFEKKIELLKLAEDLFVNKTAKFKEEQLKI